MRLEGVAGIKINSRACSDLFFLSTRWQTVPISVVAWKAPWWSWNFLPYFWNLCLLKNEKKNNEASAAWWLKPGFGWSRDPLPDFRRFSQSSGPSVLDSSLQSALSLSSASWMLTHLVFLLNGWEKSNIFSVLNKYAWILRLGQRN